ncbi:hypothetical protein GC105_00695 [Alkalibaculum sp. M08DMB]|uniref:Uncharacterized protein n=1 Tax=Alkalibaculum sporogenes TaxID=2655001 RepID=A0A6A7K4L0_9FIRM|nr:vitamin B12 dependent-methionine synthase activation domain-containing protein [Alkalibaculum sporogenes]MPW24311.1 hypothetical protein [Alkalibaculum sporogenes]
MKVEIFQDITFSINEQNLKEALKLRERLKLDDLVSELISNAEKIAKPKAIYTKLQSSVDRKNGQVFILDKVFHSKVLAESIEDTTNVFPYIITCGMEIEEWSQSIDDIMEQYIVDGIKAQILFESTEYISQKIKETNNLESLVYHIPGFLDDWPIYEQKELFSIFGDKTQEIQVYLTESSLMRPTKSVSGIYY